MARLGGVGGVGLLASSAFLLLAVIFVALMLSTAVRSGRVGSQLAHVVYADPGLEQGPAGDRLVCDSRVRAPCRTRPVATVQFFDFASDLFLLVDFLQVTLPHGRHPPPAAGARHSQRGVPRTSVQAQRLVHFWIGALFIFISLALSFCWVAKKHVEQVRAKVKKENRLFQSQLEAVTCCVGSRARTSGQHSSAPPLARTHTLLWAPRRCRDRRWPSSTYTCSSSGSSSHRQTRSRTRSTRRRSPAITRTVAPSPFPRTLTRIPTLIVLQANAFAKIKRPPRDKGLRNLDELVLQACCR